MQTLQTGIYSGSILLAVILSAWLFRKARQQKEVPGAGYYCFLTLAMCFASVGEILFMLSATEHLALFWFKARFFSFAVIPPLWLLFVLMYSGRRHWVSKALKAGLYIIPTITCVLILTSSLHPFWVQHEVEFYRQGPFLLADLSRRVPGIGYIVHTFYVQGVMLTGSLILLKTALGKIREYRLQALLLSASALVPVLISVVLIFNLLPSVAFNPTIPGLATGAALAALAVFRFDFLKSSPYTGDPDMEPIILAERRSQLLSALIFGLMAVGIISAGYFSYINFKLNLQKDLDERLSTIAHLTAIRLINWRSERMGDAEILKQNRTFSSLTEEYLNNPSAQKAKDHLKSWLDILGNSYGYDRVVLMDLDGKERLVSAGPPGEMPAHLFQDIRTVMDSGKILFLDFHRHAEEDINHLALAVPIFRDENLLHLLAIVILRIDPVHRLNPFSLLNPAPDETAEVMIIRKEKKSILFLNDFRTGEKTAFSLHIPLSGSEHPAAKALDGKTGITEGRDHQGKPVIAYTQPIPESPWFLVVQEDQDRVYAPVSTRRWRTFIFIIIFLALPVTGVTLVLRQQALRHYKEQFNAFKAIRIREEDLKRRNEYLMSLQQTTLEIISQTDLEELLENIVKRACDLMDNSSGFLDLVDQKTDRLVPKIGIGALKDALKYEVKPGEGLAGVIWQTGNPLIINDYDSWPGRVDNYRRGVLSAVMGVPLISGSQVLGVLGLGYESTTQKQFHPDAVTDLTQFARLAALAIDNARLFSMALKELAERRQAEEILKKSEERYALVVDASEQGIWDWDVETNQVYFSRQWKKQIGYEDHELTNEFDTWVDHLHPDEKDVCLNAVKKYLAQPMGHFLLEFRFRHRDGSYRWVHNKAASLKDSAGKVIRMFGSHTDITERVNASEERKAYAQRLEEMVRARTFELEAANKELEAFSYSVSHDLRAPLRHINGYINLLSKHFPEILPEKGRHYLKNIMDSATGMGELIDSLLKFSRTGRQEMKKRLINMNDIFKEALDTVCKDYPERVIQWEAARLPVVSGDFSLLKLVWVNLLDNAIKFTKNKDCAKIETGCSQDQNEIVFFVRDNGVGFDMQYAEKLFGVFQRLHSANDYKGTGIGLANVRRIILRHGGRIWAESEPDKGAIFYFSLPQS